MFGKPEPPESDTSRTGFVLENSKLSRDESGHSEKVLDSLLTEGYFFLELWNECIAHNTDFATLLEGIQFKKRFPSGVRFLIRLRPRLSLKKNKHSKQQDMIMYRFGLGQFFDK
jgi:hypothetical protein